MAVFISFTPTYPYSTVSMQGEFTKPVIFEVTKNKDDVTNDIKERRVYIVVSGENVSYLKLRTGNDTIPGLNIVFAKDYQGNPGKYEPYLEWTNLNAIDEGRDLVIPVWIKVLVENQNIQTGLYQNNLITIEYQ